MRKETIEFADELSDDKTPICCVADVVLGGRGAIAEWEVLGAAAS